MLTRELIGKTRAQIGLLYRQTEQIDRQNAQIKSARFKYRDYFNRDLFHCNSTALFDYVKEAEENLNTLLRHNQQSQHQLAPRGEQLTRQLMALVQAVRANEIAVKEQRFTSDSNKKRFANKQQSGQQAARQSAGHLMANSHQLYQELAQHHEYERRFNEMIYERQTKMAASKGQVAQQLQKEILALHQRLGRCRRAISVIEERIQMAESRNNGGRR